ncbi:MAG: flagellar hook-length control protein FliK, partial [Variovorax paradoxus]|nr:flagellar hook-length control protein FliK [Variovorax paradoxus]
MNRPIGPAVDALLASKLSSARPDLAVLQTEVGTSMPVGPMAEIQKVKNDVRLPSHAPLETRLDTGAAPALPRADAPPSIDTRWSAAARVIGAVLADLHAEPEPVRGAAPLWASPQEAPSGAVLAAALGRSVSGSGLFYES